MACHSRQFFYLLYRPMTESRNPYVMQAPLRFRLFRFRSPLLTESQLYFFSSPYLDVSVREVPTYMHYYLARRQKLGARVPRGKSRWVSPFGHRRITGS